MSIFNTRKVSNQVLVCNYQYCVTSCSVHSYDCDEFESQHSFRASFQWGLAFVQELRISPFLFYSLWTCVCTDTQYQLLHHAAVTKQHNSSMPLHKKNLVFGGEGVTILHLQCCDLVWKKKEKRKKQNPNPKGLQEF